MRRESCKNNCCTAHNRVVRRTTELYIGHLSIPPSLALSLRGDSIPSVFVAFGCATAVCAQATTYAMDNNGLATRFGRDALALMEASRVDPVSIKDVMHCWDLVSPSRAILSLSLSRASIALTPIVIAQFKQAIDKFVTNGVKNVVRCPPSSLSLCACNKQAGS